MATTPLSRKDIQRLRKSVLSRAKTLQQNCYSWYDGMNDPIYAVACNIVQHPDILKPQMINDAVYNFKRISNKTAHNIANRLHDWYKDARIVGYIS